MVVYCGQINFCGFGYLSERYPVIGMFGKKPFSRVEDTYFGGNGIA